MNDRDWASPVALARYAPVAQPEIDLAHPDRPVAARRAFKQARDFLPCLVTRQAVEKARIDHAPVALIGRIGDGERRAIHVRRADDGRIPESILVGEVDAALIVT